MLPMILPCGLARMLSGVPVGSLTMQREPYCAAAGPAIAQAATRVTTKAAARNAERLGKSSPIMNARTA
jgi:hypothetical protein